MNLINEHRRQYAASTKHNFKAKNLISKDKIRMFPTTQIIVKIVLKLQLREVIPFKIEV